MEVVQASTANETFEKEINIPDNTTNGTFGKETSTPDNTTNGTFGKETSTPDNTTSAPDNTANETFEKEPIAASTLNTGSYSASETIVDPWRRTVSQLSLGSALEPEMNSCRIEIITGGVTGPFYDRHRVYLVSVPSQNVEVGRRYKDFEWLHDTLLHKYPFRIVPNIPGKRLNLVITDEFIATRRRGLEEFMILVLNHPILQKDPLLAEFLAVENFSDVRGRIHPAWEEEFATTANTAQSNDAVEQTRVNEPDWLTYDDATKWSLQVTDAVKCIIKALIESSRSASDSQVQLSSLAKHMATILENTQHTETSAASVPSIIQSLSDPYEKFSENLKGSAQKLELFLQLITGCRDMVLRTKRMKFDHFPYMNDQIVAAQAYAEKLRVRDGPAPTPEMEKALQKVSNLQRELLYQSRRNEFADECLRHELGWVIKMTRGIPGIFTGIQSVLSQHHHTMSDLLG